VNTIPDPQNALDVFTIVAVALIGIVPSWLAHRNHKGIAEVRDQVKNAHKTNLRDDLDRAIAAVESLSHDVRGLRQDLATEEDRRRQQIAELRDDIERRR
jgi:hypothetical protein